MSAVGSATCVGAEGVTDAPGAAAAGVAAPRVKCGGTGPATDAAAAGGDADASLGAAPGAGEADGAAPIGLAYGTAAEADDVGAVDEFERGEAGAEIGLAFGTFGWEAVLPTAAASGADDRVAESGAGDCAAGAPASPHTLRVGESAFSRGANPASPAPPSSGAVTIFWQIWHSTDRWPNDGSNI